MRLAARFGFAGLMLLAAGAVQAQVVQAPVIVTVDVQQILRESLVARNIQAQMDQRTERYTKEVTAQEGDLQKTQDELERQRTVLAPDAFNSKMRDFQQRYDALDNRVQVTRQALQQAYNEAMTKVENTALQIISDMAAERKVNLVVAKAAVLFEEKSLDITQEVITRLDAKLPMVVLATPAEPAPGAVPAPGPRMPLPLPAPPAKK
jgi:Skp family chaperone for outer membrane proteins